MKNKGLYEKHLKRLLDFTLAFVGLLVLAPVMLVVAVLVRKKLGKPVIFAQLRPGLNEKIFKMYKFRTMTDERDSNGTLLSDEKRLTPFGKFLRSSSLDELPELVNILKGEMSFLGPRPLAVQYLPYYSDSERLRHSVRPGLSGLAQINGRNNLTWEERFAYDLEYIKKITFLNDCWLIIKSILVAINRNNITVRKSDGSTDFDKYRIRQIEKGINYEY